MSVIAIFLFLAVAPAGANEHCSTDQFEDAEQDPSGNGVASCHPRSDLVTGGSGGDASESSLNLLPPVDVETPDVEGYGRENPPEEKKLPALPVRKPATDAPAEPPEKKDEKAAPPKTDDDGLKNDRPSTIDFTRS